MRAGLAVRGGEGWLGSIAQYATGAYVKKEEHIVAAYATRLRKCGNLTEGRRIHAQILREGYGEDRYLGNLLVQMYGNCGSVQDGRAVFDRIRGRNIFSWTILAAAFAQNGELEDARGMFDKMPEQNLVAFNGMVAAYAQNGLVHDATALFERIPGRDVVSCNTVITAHVSNGNIRDAQFIFEQMPQWDVVSWTAMIQAYAKGGNMAHARSIFNGMPQRDVVAWNAMIQACAQSDQLQDAKSMFDRMPQRDVVSWTALMVGYAGDGYLEDARSMFDRMPQHSLVTWNAMLQGYVQNERLKDARRLFDEMPERDAVSRNAMIAGYGCEGDMEEAKRMFDEMVDRDVVTWTAILLGYAHSGRGTAALELFKLMDLEGIKPDEASYISILEVCAGLSALGEGRAVHAEIVDSGIELSAAMGSAITNMLGRCGRVEEAMSIFKQLPHRDTVSWNTMLATYAHHGHADEAIQVFRMMGLEGVSSDNATLISILASCSHAGLVCHGWLYFVLITDECGVVPTLDHYVCMIDLLGRAGQLEEAQDLIANMPFEPDLVAWMTLLAACSTYGAVARAAAAKERILQLDPRNIASCRLMSIAYGRKLPPSTDGPRNDPFKMKGGVKGRIFLEVCKGREGRRTRVWSF